MATKSPRKVWRLDPDGRLRPRANQIRWRVISGDVGRVDPAADYLFCALDFLFPADGTGRALRLEVDSRPSARKRPAGRGPASSAARSRTS
ncbi:MAG: hypothetical protein FJ027_04450 [Candidatus Rokubacteria bacterium]|nr:hypothetical protein [Candidatus Rokubacteria bacterium]